ncbi:MULTISPECIES: phage tail protein [unclassified Sphingomonas]|uniref:phage tail protein n=1 Tax=unclassified Sphingomonas TaxID=196159 RepID=UPI00082ED672|nr:MULTISPECIES: tail fiber protein [unclassified Sphingomonas]
MATPMIGQIMTVGFNFAPRDYALCQGQTMAIAQNTALFSLLGTTYGGNGQTTYALPDLRGRVVLNQGQGPGLSMRTLGEQGGTETTTLTSSNMAQHVHAATGATGTVDAVDVKALQQSPTTGAYLGRGTDGAGVPDMIPRIYVPAATGNPATKIPLAGVNLAGNTQIAGSGTAFSTVQPTLVINQCIALFGIYPSRN